MPTTNRNSESDAANVRRAPLASISDCEAPPDKGLIEREGAPCMPRWDANLYATKKSVAQGMMDIALLTANACQLKYVLREEEEDSRFFLINISCIGISISLQVIVGILLILNTRYNINLTSQQQRAELLNNLTIIGIFLITIVNVFLSAFGTSK
ncbi:ninjurin-2-like [Tachypleus tridentatus]|uniref:ninjurin-2-like n=1 Tax=Tachypleus tridentatus TaxID=6853 RepID=UPI003FD2BEFD